MKPKKKLAPYINLNSLRGKVWKQFSIYIRSKDADWKGEVNCFSCGKKDHWKNLQAGHFHHQILDYEPLNIHPQCPRCNKWLKGNLGNYAHALVKKYGAKVLDKLADKKKNYKPENIIELQKLLNHYTKVNKENGY